MFFFTVTDKVKELVTYASHQVKSGNLIFPKEIVVSSSHTFNQFIHCMVGYGGILYFKLDIGQKIILLYGTFIREIFQNDENPDNHRNVTDWQSRCLS